MDRKLFNWHATMCEVMTVCMVAFLTGRDPVLMVFEDGIEMGIA